MHSCFPAPSSLHTIVDCLHTCTAAATSLLFRLASATAATASVTYLLWLVRAMSCSRASLVSSPICLRRFISAVLRLTLESSWRSSESPAGQVQRAICPRQYSHLTWV